MASYAASKNDTYNFFRREVQSDSCEYDMIAQTP